MAKFTAGSWVRPKNSSDLGIVRGHIGSKTKVRWVGSKKAAQFPTAQLQKAKEPTGLILEGSLDGDLNSVRSEEDLLRNWFTAVDVKMAYKTIHCVEDLPIIAAAMKGPPAFVHISCHGDYDGERPYLTFAPRGGASSRIYLDEEKVIRVFAECFAGYPVLFSTCLLGRLERPMSEFRKATKLGEIAAFTRSVYDSEAMLFELMLYHGILVEGHTFKAAVANALAAANLIGIKGTPGKHQAFVRLFG